MRYGLPSHGKKGRLKIVSNLQRLQQAGIGPFTNSVVRPKKDVRPLAALSRCLKFVGDILLRFHLYGNAKLLFESLPEFNQWAVTAIVADPDKKFAVFPGKAMVCGEDHKESKEEIFEGLAHFRKLPAITV
jgi:hypothetical protein